MISGVIVKLLLLGYGKGASMYVHLILYVRKKVHRFPRRGGWNR